MALEPYSQARKLAVKNFRSDSSRGIYPYLQVLDEILSYTDIAAETELGLVDIPLESIVGTKSAARTNAFASNFMPLLSESSEFSSKWSNLYESHMKEGIRDPIRAYEFMNHFYVSEGNKRVSILKFCDAVTIPGYVTRIIPKPNHTKENRIYYEFLNFYKGCGINYLNFSQIGNYKKILELLGKNFHSTWTDDEKKTFHASYYRFLKIFEKKEGRSLSLTPGDAFLIFLEIYGYEDLLKKDLSEISKEVAAIWKDFQMYPSKPSVKLLMDSKDPGPEKKRFNLNLLFPAGKLKIAFIHNKSPETSSWTYGHELGRAYLEDSLKEKVETRAWFHVDSPKAEQMAFEEAISWGCSVIFSTSPLLLSSSIKYAMKYPKLCVLNCSLNTGDDHIKTYYGRLYEAKFLMGAVAGIMSKSDKIGYIADYPIFGMIANINAFALGVRMIRPEAKIYLEWSTLKHNNVEKIRKNFAISFISDRDFMIPNKDSNRFGLYQTDGKQPVNLIMPTWNWGVFYETIAKSILDGTWKQPGNSDGKTSLNYWWGMSSDMIDVIYSSKLPSGTRQLINLLRKSIQIGDFNPFSGTIYSQDGLVHNNPDAITPKEIVTMDWLCDNIIGSIPTMDEISDEAKSIVELQGVSKAKQTTKESL